ncbi:MAG: Ltp family lipoprotein, partial [Culicoidibacterales bacterium]
MKQQKVWYKHLCLIALLLVFVTGCGSDETPTSGNNERLEETTTQTPSVEETPSVETAPEVEETPSVETAPEVEAPSTSDSATSEQKNALKTAEKYLKFTSMSKGGLYDQLIYEQFSEEQAQYAVDQIQADWNEQALKTAENYLKFSSMSNGGLYDQLIYEQFSAEQAQYAIDNLATTTSENSSGSSSSSQNEQALKTAEKYLEFTAMSKGGLYDQLIYEQFSEEQAQYAVDQ